MHVDAGGAKVRVGSVSGMLGYGYPEESFWSLIDHKPDFLGCDAGSTDPGPYYLGSGKAYVSRQAYKRDLKLMLLGATREHIPALIGSAGGHGSRRGVAWTREILTEISREEGLNFDAAFLYSDLTHEQVGRLWDAGRIKALPYAPNLSKADLMASTAMVAMMGHHPHEHALAGGAGVVIGGRGTDPAPFAAGPLSRGISPGPTWFASKILDCGAASADPYSAGDCVFADLYDDRFVIEPVSPQRRYTVASLAAWALHENPHPFLIPEPGGTIDIEHAEFRQLTPRAVEVRGSRFHPADRTTLKIEAVRLSGYRSICIGITRDPVLIRQIDEYLEMLTKTVERLVDSAYGGRLRRDQWRLTFHQIGRHSVLGEVEPVQGVNPHELGLLIDVVAPDQDTAEVIAAYARTYGLHSHFRGRLGTGGNLALPFSPAEVPYGPVYEWVTTDHVIDVDSEFDLVNVEFVSFRAGR